MTKETSILQIPDPERRGFLLEEYKALRAEIVSQQQQRTAILGFALTGIGVAGSLSARLLEPQGQAPQGVTYAPFYAAALIMLVFVILIIAAMMTAGFCQAVDNIANYIRHYVEGELGLSWENRWHEVRRAPKKKRYKRLGISKTYALVYGLLLVCACGLATMIVASATPSQRLPLGFCFGACALVTAFFVLDLWLRLRPSWKDVWEVYEAAKIKPVGSATANSSPASPRP
ncbi:MAG TPA: hypothetical protein VHE55_08875 [Fimbriimonadaceae bacterium]|nr:hypothetical protein [Fimbriimonadaceae bacterium]